MTSYGGYTTTTYGVGGDDGGGFMAGGSQGGSQAQGGGRSYADETLRPVTIKQLIQSTPSSASDNMFRIDGTDVSQVTFVGQVRQINPQATNITYRLDDGTGIIEVKKWIDPDRPEGLEDDNIGPNNLEKPILLDQYVRVWGRLKSLSNKKLLSAHIIRPVECFDEVSYHLLEATYCHLYFTRGGAVGGAAGGGDGMFVDSYGGQTGGYGSGGGIDGLTPQENAIYECLKNSGNEGFHVDHMSRTMGISYRDAKETAETLMAKGRVYTTVDDDTYAILEY